MMPKPCIRHTKCLDRGLAYGESCFETFRVIKGEVFLWQSHWSRLAQGLTTFSIELPNTWERTIYNQCLLAAKEKSEDCLVRLTITGGEADWGLMSKAEPNIYIQAMAYTKSEKYIALNTVNYPFPLHKKSAKYSSDYSLTLQAIQTWNIKEPKTALVCKDGHILSGITANIAFYTNNNWLTPMGNGILPGIIQQHLSSLQFIAESTFTIKLLNGVEAAVFLNAGSFIQPIASINDIRLNPQHEAIQTLQNHLRTQTGVNI